MALPDYEVFAIRYATVDRKAADNFMRHDAHDGLMPLDFFIWAIRDGNRCVVVDTGFSEESSARRKRQYLCHPADGLRELGIDAGAVADVILTHLHYDHAGNFGLFKRAAFHLQDAEMAYATGRHMSHHLLNHFFEVDDVTGLVRQVYAGRVRFHDGDAQIAPGISVHKVGGHTAGLQVVRVHTARGWIVLASDAAHYYANLDEVNPFPAIFDVGQMLDGYRKLEELADSPAYIIPGHDPEVLRIYPRQPSDKADIACLHRPPALWGGHVQALPISAALDRLTDGHTARLAAFAVSAHGLAFDEEVLRHARRHLIDTVGAMLAGSRLAFFDGLEQVLAQLRPAGEVPVPGRRRRADLLDAIYLAASAGHSGEVDDGFRQGSIHPGTVVVPAALMLGYRRRCSGKELLTAIIAGYESIAAVSRFAHPHLRKQGFHPTAVVGALGAAVSAGVLARADVAVMRTALGIAASAASGLFAFASGGADIKRLHPGHAAREGVFSMLLAQQGVSAPVSVLESRDGFFQTYVGADNMRGQAFMLPPDVPYAITHCYLKPYACCRHLQPAVDALLAILAREAIEATDIEAIEVETYSIAAAHATVPWQDTAEAQLSFPYVLAAAAIARRVTLEEFAPACLVDPAINDLCHRIRVSASARMDASYPATRPARVTVAAKGRRHACEVAEAKGDPAQPLSDQEVNDKFLSLAAPALGQQAAAALLAQLWHIDQSKDIAPVVDSMAAGRANS